MSSSPPPAPPAPYRDNGRIPNTPLAISLVSFLLGSTFALGVATTLSGNPLTPAPAFHDAPWWLTGQLGFFVAAWATFHWGEYAVTAGWNLEKCSVDSFLLENGTLYHIAHATALTEYFITLWFFPSWKTYPKFAVAGLALVVLGQTLRSTAMIHAATNFSHAVAFKKRDAHVLVTDGIYAWLRHPSYTGFFYWALGTQLVLQNRFSFVLYLILLWRFFFYRIRAEERALVVFFGDAYVQYRKRVGTLMPFIP
ncbi:Protein-S-isoprenylcysteine O-methyltransferase [Mycena chlorophos]|uniref:Protein-S-isoprenylcysteine O-methyltransferase n=1 Tax=Mycena chlorophos TaxID=658473 RepID=A0A8H6VY36_MYCCL|nr:Protein-S-isoprenylcysteine O-methyltransferase [Mycena chlorophos]